MENQIQEPEDERPMETFRIRIGMTMRIHITNTIKRSTLSITKRGMNQVIMVEDRRAEGSKALIKDDMKMIVNPRNITMMSESLR